MIFGVNGDVASTGDQGLLGKAKVLSSWTNQSSSATELPRLQQSLQAVAAELATK